MSSLVELLSVFNRSKVMVIGDMVADIYVEGKVSRISREAPVLVLEHVDEKMVPGGAANVLNNIAALGGFVQAVGFVGDDQAGANLNLLLAANKVQTEGILVVKSRPTISKTRIMAGGQATVRQQVVRLDKEAKYPLAAEYEQALLDYILANLINVDVVVISDYGSHTISPLLVRQVLAECNRVGIPTIVDSRYNIMEYVGVSVVKQNESEAAAAIGLKSLDNKTLLEAGTAILDKLNAKAVLITRGDEGMTLFQQNGKIDHIPVTDKSEVYDVSGAGDTAVAVLALALGAGASYAAATHIANFAAGIVVRKAGTATTSISEIEKAILKYNKDAK